MASTADMKDDAQGARSEGVSYQALLDREPNPVPAALRENTNSYLGCAPISTERYLSEEYYQREKQKLWPKVWQAVCRETEIAKPGDFYSHEIADKSIFVVRNEQQEIKGFVNACLHRGRQLKSGVGNSPGIQCPYHGFSWNLDGGFCGAPCQWDFAHVEADTFQLPQVKVDTWGGWVFINMDPAAISLGDYMGDMVEHFERWAPQETYKALHIKKVIRCNWKLAHEAFIESFHTLATHPQLLLYTADANSQYDCFNEHVSRTITPMGVVSPHLSDASEQQSADQWRLVNELLEEDWPQQIPAGKTAREHLGDMNIQRFSQLYQRDLSSLATHSEVLDAILYSIFPNFAPWGGFRPNVTYRFLPYQDSHQLCTMEIFLLMRYPDSEPRPADCAEVFVPADQSFASTDGIPAGLARVFDQDFSNLPQVQRGLKSQLSGEIQLGNYQEVRIRHFNQTLDRYINR